MATEAENGNFGAAAAVKEVVFTAVKPQMYVEAPKAKEAMQFYKAAFGAEEVSCDVSTKRKADQEMPMVVSAELKLGGVSFLVSDFAADEVKSAGTGFTFCLETDDVSAAVAKAVAAGAVSEGEITESENGCCGGVVGKLKDPYGFTWMICSPAKKAAPAIEVKETTEA